jgi:predicted nucleotidyltransferase
MADQAYLSFRLPAAERDRIKAAAAQRGESVQDLMGRLVGRFLDQEDRRSPSLSDVLRRLRDRKDEWRRRGVAKLWVFGSVVRGDARPDSDVDVVVEFDPAARVTLTGFARLRQDLEDTLGLPVDLAEWRTLKPRVRETAEHDAVAVF